jgi:acetyltransferase-like isoleucine patch superfamily enzyme
MPFITGHAEIHVGNNVGLGGLITISSGAIFEKPQLIIKDGARLGWGATITVNREVVIEEDVFISYNCNISDSDGHPREADLRVAGARPFEKDIRPVRIGRYAWIGNGTYIMKGVTVGEGAVIGANSVVISNVPPYCLALGNPAEILFKNYGLPSTARRAKKPLEPPAQQV